MIAGNRDEFHDRATRAASPWDDPPGLLAGQDLEAGGTWLGVMRDGRVAALTNIRSGAPRKALRSRGALVLEALRFAGPPEEHFLSLVPRLSDYGDFNLLAGGPEGLAVFSSQTGRSERVGPGLHLLSNTSLDTPWPKVTRTKAVLTRLVTTGEPLNFEALFQGLGDRSPSPDGELPETGVGIEMERFLSPPFIVGPRYGTRSSTVVLVGGDGSIEFRERRFLPSGEPSGEVRFALEPSGWREVGRI
jgi:uncharacterized protein with NRDE domain